MKLDELVFVRLLKYLLSWLIVVPAFALPYLLRIAYIVLLSRIIHAPFHIFGHLAGYLMRELGIAQEKRTVTPPRNTEPRGEKHAKSGKAVVLFSGGTDSTCAAALLAEKHAEIHLLTFEERATKNSPVPLENARLLERHFADVRFTTAHLSVDGLVRHFWYERYIHFMLRHGRLALATPGLSSLSWHVRTILYCRERGIMTVADGLTRELMHFPGHMDRVVERIRALYAAFGITYENPVRDWPTPPDQQFMDKVLVDRHAHEVPWASHNVEKTTGRHLYDIGFFPSPDMKGSRRDFSMQHECYPFALYNIIAFWGFLTFSTYETFSSYVSAYMEEKIQHAEEMLRAHLHAPPHSALSRLIARTP